VTEPDPDDVVLTTCPRDCYDACGIEVSRRNGVIRRVRGDRHHAVSRGRLCQKCTAAYNGVFLDPAARLVTPLLRDGDRARLRTATGELELMVVLSPDLPRGVALSPKGRWPRLEPQGANVNILNPGIPSDMGASSTVHGVEVTVAPAPTSSRL
jgi:anaerobic selenocysteine-containing dehydrogenase